MLIIKVATEEGFDEAKKEFVETKSVVVKLEHSLASLSMWESTWETPFLSKEEKSTEETISYARMMILNKDLPESVFQLLIINHLGEINKYIEAKMTATWFQEAPNSPRNREIITAEIIYYWMISLNIPFECQYWHLNRLLTLIRVMNLKNAPKKKISARSSAERRRQLNEQRRATYGTRG